MVSDHFVVEFTSSNTIREKSERIRSGTIQPREPLTVIRHEQPSFSQQRDAVCVSVFSRSLDSVSLSPFYFHLLSLSLHPILLCVSATFYFVTRQCLCARCVCVWDPLTRCTRQVYAAEKSRREFYIGCRKLINHFSSMDLF